MTGKAKGGGGKGSAHRPPSAVKLAANARLPAQDSLVSLIEVAQTVHRMAQDNRTTPENKPKKLADNDGAKEKIIAAEVRPGDKAANSVASMSALGDSGSLVKSLPKSDIDSLKASSSPPPPENDNYHTPTPADKLKTPSPHPK